MCYLGKSGIGLTAGGVRVGAHLIDGVLHLGAGHDVLPDFGRRASTRVVRHGLRPPLLGHPQQVAAPALQNVRERGQLPRSAWTRRPHQILQPATPRGHSSYLQK